VELRLAGYQPLAAELAPTEGARVIALTPVRARRSRPGRTAERAERPHAEVTREPPKRPAPSAESTPKPAAPSGPYERFD
jgi:hypothetical protein